jgi:heme A synthase
VLPVVRYAWFVLVFNVGVIAMGAIVRATGSGAGCGPSWPTCHGEIVPELAGATAVEFTHRALSGIALLMVVALAVWVWRATDRGHPARRGAVLSVIAIVGEALIGAMIVLAEWVADDTSMARTITVPLHLVNTLFLLAALALTIHWLGGGGRLDWSSRPAVSRAVVLGAVALVLIAATGAVTALADTLFPKSGIDDEATEHLLTRLRIVHPVLAVAGAGAGWWAVTRNGMAPGRAGKALPILVGLMLLTGVVNIGLGVPVAMQVTHLVLADALWVAFVLASAQALGAREVAGQSVTAS